MQSQPLALVWVAEQYDNRPSHLTVRNSFCREITAIDTKYAKYSTEQLEVILTHLSDPAEKELVKTELSKRYFDHYHGLLQTPPDQAGTSPPETATPAEGAATSELPPGQAQPPSGALEEELAGIPEVGPITLKLPPPQEAPAHQAGQQAPGKSKRKFCFIATAAYGSPLAPEVAVLQNFRDTYLSRHSLGERCIEVYYRVSPHLAGKISQHPAWRRLTRFFLAPIIFLLKKSPKP